MEWSGKLSHSVEILLENLPVLQALGLLLCFREDVGFELVLRGAVHVVIDAEVAGEGFERELVGRDFIGDIVRGGYVGEDAAFAWVRGIEGAFEELDAFAEALHDAEAVVVHRGFHHLEDVRGVRGRGARDKGRTRGDELFDRVDRMIDGAPDVGLALEPERRCWRGLFLRQAVNKIIHHAIRHLDVLARGVIEVIAADGERVAVATKDEDMQVGPRQRHAAREGQGASVNVMRAVRLHEIREAAGAADARNSRDLLVMNLPLLDQFEVEREHGEIAAARAPRRMVGGGFLFRERLAIGVRERCWRGQRGGDAGAWEGFVLDGDGAHVGKK